MAQDATPKLSPLTRRRRQLFGGLLLLAVVTITAATFTLFQLYEQAETRAKTITQNMANSLDLTLSGMIDTIDVALQSTVDGIEKEISQGRLDRQHLSAMLARQQNRLPMPTILRMTDQNGDILYGTGVIPSAANIADRETFRFHANYNTRELFIDSPVISPVTNEWVWVLSRRLNHADGSFAGVLHAVLPIAEINKLFKQAPSFAQTTIVLRDRHLKLVARHVAPDMFYTPGDDRGPSAVLQTMLRDKLSENSYFRENSTFDDVSRIYSYRRSAKYHYFVGVGVTPQVIFAAWRRQAIILGSTVAAFLLVSLAFVAFVTRTWRLQDEIQQSLLEAQEIAQLGNYIYDVPADTWRCSIMLEQLFGIDAAFARTAQSWLQLIAPEDRDLMADYLRNTLEQGSLFDREYRICRQSDQSLRWVHGKGVVHQSPTGQPLTLVGTIQDITERKLAEQARHESEEILQKLLETTNDGYWCTDDKGRILDVNPAYCQMSGYTREELLSMCIADLRVMETGEDFDTHLAHIISQNNLRFESVHRRKNGSPLYLDISVTFSQAAGGRIQGFMRDISDRIKHEKELEQIAYFDTLTGVPNRRLLFDRLNQAIAHSQRHGIMMAVCYLDLDNFKPINDKYGHEVGDRVLIDFANRIKAVLRTEDTLARLGGDEFVLLLTQIAHIEEIHVILKRVLACVQTPIEFEGRSVNLSASIGVTLFPDDHVDADTLLRHADQAMYRAKESGKNCYRLFDQQHDQKVQARLSYLNQLRDALHQEQFVLYYQPKIDMLDGRVIGVEALIRWQHPERGLLPPAEFLGYLETSELESAVGEWVIDSALAQLAEWDQAGVHLSVGVNISATHLLQANFASRLQQLLTQHPNVTPDRLELEIIESAALSDLDQAIDTLNQCRDLGVKLALDDFGTGYSSLAYLRALPIHTLKIDQSFVRDMLDDPSDMGIVVSVLQLAKTFDRAVIAEGVETLEHGKKLMQIGCRLMQGYGVALPMPAAKIPDWVAQWGQQAS